ncbi:hypothetical protein WDW37_13090 [Bdellovibrionota bacterium FG-1]
MTQRKLLTAGLQLVFSILIGVCGGAFVYADTSTAQAMGATPSAIQVTTSFVSVEPSSLGIETGLSLLFQPFVEHEWVVGPKASVLFATGQGKTRFDLNSGIDSIFWVANAFGPGLALDVVAPSSISGEDGGARFRIEPNLAVRFKRFQDEGAWGLRLGVPYDSRFKWGVQVGLTLQLGGVPVIGGAERSEALAR